MNQEQMVKELTHIYALSCPENGLIRYIGKSDNPKQRFSRHINERVVTKKGSWIRSLKNKGLKPNLIIIDSVPICDWQFWEKHYIKLFKSCGANLLNMNEGGYGAYTENSTRDKQRLAKFGKILKEETRKKISEANKGKKIPEHLKLKLSLERKGKKLHPNTYKGLIEKISIKVSSYDLFGNKIKTYNSISDASNDTTVAKTVISKICRKNLLYNKSKGLTFRFGEENKIYDISYRNKGKTIKPIVQYDLNNNFVGEFETITSAANKYNLHISGISAVCRGVKKTAGGFIWKYKQEQQAQ